MPGIARKIFICATVDGLVVHPLTSKREAYSSPTYKIKYGDASISATGREGLPDASKSNASFEAYGIVGLITVSSFSYLISITRRQQVAQIRGNPIYVITEVALTPCSSYQDANSAITDTATALSLKLEKDADDGAATDAEDDSDNISISGSLETVPETVPGPDDELPARRPSPSPRNSVAEDVISRRGSYGRFAQRWFSRTGWATDQKRNMGLSTAAKEEQDRAKEADTNKEVESAVEQVQPMPEGNAVDENGKEDASKGAIAAAKVAADQDPKIPAAGGLLPKLLRTTQILFGTSHSYYFSYDHDITRSCANPRVPETPLFPLHDHVDPQYFWNRNIIRPLIDAGADSLALPLMQGFVGQRTFTVDSHPPQVDDSGAKDSVELGALSPSEEKPEGALVPSRKQFDITIISRRSVKRAGLRYCRRGVDEDGNPANNVESEQILSPSELDENSKVYSFVQVRGSIPLFFTQSPYSLKPVPVMQHSAEANFQALKKHFDALGKKYGGLQVVNLVEKHGTEGKIGDAYESNVKRLNDEARGDDNKVDKVPFEWFDFHDACRGMKFENVSLLLQTLGKKLETYGSTVVVDGKVTTTQAGVLRTNCMDCLDRTNVCQSSFAKYMLDFQLKEQGFDMNAQADQEISWFNNLWADNGDAISKQYASTAAMKGDYTRTKKRNYRGALTDAGLSLTRFYNGMVNDFFVQATIDFLLGNVSALVFEEFQATMMTKDPAVSMFKMRETAIELCQKRVVEDSSEDFVGGWTMLTPHTPDTIRPQQTMEEAVLLLTDKAVYLCRFDWNLDKVSSFERVDLAHVEGIKFGTYISSTLTAAHTDEEKNVGLVVEYKPGREDVQRINTRSLSSLGSISNSKTSSSSTDTAGPTAAAAGNNTSIVENLFGRRIPMQQQTPVKKIVLKALYTTTSLADPALKDPGGAGEGEGISKLTEIQQVVTVAAEIERLAIAAQPGRFEGKKEGEKTLVEKGDIISLAQARASTGLLDQIGHSIKKLVWA